MRAIGKLRFLMTFAKHSRHMATAARTRPFSKTVGQDVVARVRPPMQARGQQFDSPTWRSRPETETRAARCSVSKRSSDRAATALAPAPSDPAGQTVPRGLLDALAFAVRSGGQSRSGAGAVAVVAALHASNTRLPTGSKRAACGGCARRPDGCPCAGAADAGACTAGLGRGAGRAKRRRPTPSWPSGLLVYAGCSPSTGTMTNGCTTTFSSRPRASHGARADRVTPGRVCTWACASGHPDRTPRLRRRCRP